MWGHGYYRIFKDGRSELQLNSNSGSPSTKSNKEDIKSALSTLAGKKADKHWTKLSNLPPPIAFTKQCKAQHKTKNETLFIQEVFFICCKCIRLASIDNKLRITDDYHTPESKIWFVIEGETINGRSDKTTAAVLVNEQVDGFYPLTKTKSDGYRISDNFTPNNAKTDFTRLSIGDKELITMAVKHYLSNLTTMAVKHYLSNLTT